MLKATPVHFKSNAKKIKKSKKTPKTPKNQKIKKIKTKVQKLQKIKKPKHPKKQNKTKHTQTPNPLPPRSVHGLYGQVPAFAFRRETASNTAALSAAFSALAFSSAANLNRSAFSALAFCSQAILTM
jgi:outer membrane biosynthesis protein TonB